MALLVTASLFLAHLDADDRLVDAETERINALPDGTIDNPTLKSFGDWVAAYHAFGTVARAKADSASVIVAPNMNEEDDTLILHERNLRSFQDVFASKGAPPPAFVVPRDSPDHPSNAPGHGGGLTLPDLPGFGLDTSTKIVLGLGAAAILVVVLKR